MKLYIKQKVFSIRDKFHIYDENGEVKYTATGEILTLGKKLHITDAYDRERIFISQRLMTFLPKFEIEINGSEPVEIVKNFTLFRHEFSIPQWGITIHGDFFAHEYEVLRNGTEIAHLSKEWFTFGDAYAIEIMNPEDELMALSAILVVDCCMERRNNGN